MQSDSDNNFRDFFTKNIDFLFILDMDGNIIETNKSVTDILGYSNDELIGKNIIMVHPKEFREEAKNTVGRMISGEECYCPIPLLTKNNKYIPVETRVIKGKWNSKDALIGVSRNLSDLKLSEEKFFNVFNLSHVLLAISDPKTGIFIDVNKKFLTVLGYTKEEVIGKTSMELDIFSDYNQRKKALELFFNYGVLEDFEIVIKTKQGELLNCLFSIDKIKIQTHEYLITSATNITLLKKAEHKIKFLYNQQKLLADVSQILNSSKNNDYNEVLKLLGEHTKVSRVYIFEDDETGLFTSNTFEWCNEGILPQINNLQQISYDLIPSWKKLLLEKGFIFSENIDDLPQDLYDILEPQAIKSILIFPLLIGNSFYGFIGFDECKRYKIWKEEEKFLLKTVSNIVSNAFEKNNMLSKLEISEIRLKMAIKSANEGIWDWNNETGAVYFSDTWCSMLGYEPGEIAPNVSSWEKLVHPDDMPFVTETLIKHLNGETEYYETIHRIKTKNGNWKWILDHGMVIQRNLQNQPVRTIGTHIDVTKQKEIEQKLKELIETKDKLFSIISHDLRGPIGNFLPILDFLTRKNEIDENNRNKLLLELKKASRFTFGLLENLLNWSRSQTNSIKLKQCHFNVSKIITENIELLSSISNQKNITINAFLVDELIAFADIDSVNLILRNLISNAIKFTPNNGIIKIFLKENENNIEISIVDSGVGIKKEIADTIFKTTNFYTTKGTNKESGSGLGLVLCKDFVERNGGEIRVESTLGEGSKFIFTIPKN